MKKRIKQVIGVIIGIIIGISTTVGATTIFNSKDITYSSDKTSKTNVKDSLDELYNKTGKCPEGQYCYTAPVALSDKVELGDYIRMTPTSTSYTPPGELTGCMNDANCTQNKLNPSELNLWRVIRKNEDGTVDAVSEYVSSSAIIFTGKTGFINLVRGLNMIASQYTDGVHVARTRHMGYSNQTQTITDRSKIDSVIATWKKDTSNYNQWLDCDSNFYLCGMNEPLGAGDIGYEIDYNLVNEVYGTVKGQTKDDVSMMYWLASRAYRYYPSNGGQMFGVNHVWNSGIKNMWGIFDYSTGGKYRENKPNFSVRPIVTIRSDVLLVSGDGKSVDTAYAFE